MNPFADLPTLIDRGTKIMAVERSASDRMIVFAQISQWANARHLPVYLWNPGFERLQQVTLTDSGIVLDETEWVIPGEVLASLSKQCPSEGIYLIEGLLQSLPDGEVPVALSYQLLNAYYQLATQPYYWVILESYILLPLDLQPVIPVLEKGLPDRRVVDAFVSQWVPNLERLTDWDDPEARAYLSRSCQGLPEGEVQIALQRFTAESCQATAQRIIRHKTEKLKGCGLEFISEPDVPKAGGLDLLAQRLDVIAMMLNPQVQNYGLKFPVGMILWGPPGTGKSLSAKLTAKKMGVPLLATDWGGILGSRQPDVNLRQVLSLAEALSPCILYFDDLDKGLGDWNSGADGGVGRRMIGKLLTWMQERQSPVFLVATVNRVGMLPPELIRRFDDIFFVDLPNNGELYQIFNLWLAKYFPAFRGNCETDSPFSDDQWRILLREYQLCTAAEIAKAVRITAENIAYRELSSGRTPEFLTVVLQDLLEHRKAFVPQMIREENQMFEIRNLATFARPASGEDTSRFAIPPQTLFGATTR